LTGQVTREEALERISKPELDERTMAKEFEYVATKNAFHVVGARFTCIPQRLDVGSQ